MQTKNYDYMLTHLQRNLVIESPADFEARINLLDIEDISIIYDRWGIQDGQLWLSFNRLDKKLNVKNSKSLYQMAEENLRKAKFVMMLRDHSKLPFSLAYRLGVLGCSILATDCCSIYGEQLWDAICNLPEEIRAIIKYKYIENCSPNTYTYIAEKLCISRYIVKNRENLGLATLNSWKDQFVYQE